PIADRAPRDARRFRQAQRYSDPDRDHLRYRDPLAAPAAFLARLLRRLYRWLPWAHLLRRRRDFSRSSAVASDFHPARRALPFDEVSAVRRVPPGSNSLVRRRRFFWRSTHPRRLWHYLDFRRHDFLGL